MAYFIKAFMETEDVKEQKKLLPIVKLADAYIGSLNASYRNRNLNDGINYAAADLQHRETLREKIKAILPAGYMIGAGSSHLWIARHTATDLEWDTKQQKLIPGAARAINGPWDRVVLIADHDSV